jgi:hypothetical protein
VGRARSERLEHGVVVAIAVVLDSGRQGELLYERPVPYDAIEALQAKLLPTVDSAVIHCKYAS